ncbi:MAG: M13 family metallopeptidase, partial [Cellulomonas sp.]
MTRSGIDLSALDPAVRPQDDLFGHMNGRWITEHEIPADRAMDGQFRILHDQAERDVRDIILEAAEQPTTGDGDATVESKIGALYASFMDTAAIVGRGSEPLREDLALIDSATDRAELTAALGALQRTGAVAGVSFWVDNDAKDPDRYVVVLHQSGLGLPDESYYREDRYADIRTAYQAHVARMLGLAGYDDAVDQAASVLALETRLAAAHWDVVRDRDAELTYNPTRLSALAETAVGFDWHAWVRSLGAPTDAFDALVVREPSFAEEFARSWTEVALADWQAWLRFHVVSARAPYLTDTFVDANFDFYGHTLTGAEELRERWKRGVSVVQGALGEAVGKVYVARHFPPGHKARMEVLVANLIEAYRESITALDWMGEATKVRALAKLDAFTPKIGYPARWRDYGPLIVRADDLVGNIRRANAFEQDRELAKIGRPVDRDEWFMTPQTVNAYYNPGLNEIVFPAAILQPPFFDPEADDAANYGGIGAV